MPNDGTAAHTLTANDRVLMTAILSQDAETVTRAWRAWRVATDLDALPDEQYLLLPALYANLARFGLAPEADPRIKGVYRRTWYANQRLSQLATVALAVLGEVNIPAMLIGAAAVQDLYDMPGERPIGQIELLVAPADVTCAANTLGSFGWQSVVKLTLLTTPEYRQWMHQAMFRRAILAAHRNDSSRSVSHQQAEAISKKQANDRTASDSLVLAWRALPAAPASSDAARFAALALDAHAVPACLRREAHLILASARAAEGGPSRLLALVDVCMIMRADAPLDWKLVLDLANLLASARPLTAALSFLSMLTGLPDGAYSLAGLAQMGRDELPYEHFIDARGLAGRANFHLRRWRRIARGQGIKLTPLSLLRYLQAAAGVNRLYQLPVRLSIAFARAVNLS